MFARTKDYGLMGMDCYPLIIASRIQSMGDWLGTFTEKLMDGRYSGDFYRPLVNLSFALDYAVWGLKPFGYQLTNVLLFAGCASALYLLSRRLLGGAAVVGPVVAVLAFMLHPSMVEVIGVPSRRGETMAGLFMALSLWLQLSPDRLTGGGTYTGRLGGEPRFGESFKAVLVRGTRPAAVAMLAMASKETALCIPVLSAAVLLLYSPRSGVWARLGHVATAMLPYVVALGVMVAARFAVLGGMGGHGLMSIGTMIQQAPRTLSILGTSLLFPQGMVRPSGWIMWLVGVGAALLIATCVAMLIKRPREVSTGRWSPRVVSATGFALIFTVVMVVASAATGRVEPWYLLLPTMGFALLAGALVQWLWMAIIWKPPAAILIRLGVVVCGTLIVSLLVWQARHSAVVYHYDEWERATEASASFLEDLARIETAPGGVVIETLPLPNWVAPRWNQPTVYGGAILAGYSVQAWADLMFPGRKVRVVSGRNRVPPDPDEVVVLVTKPLRGFGSRQPARGESVSNPRP